MAGRIQGITVEIGGDTTKLQTALKGVNTEIRNTQSQLRDVDKLLKLDPGNKELLLHDEGLLEKLGIPLIPSKEINLTPLLLKK